MLAFFLLHGTALKGGGEKAKSGMYSDSIQAATQGK